MDIDRICMQSRVVLRKCLLNRHLVVGEGQFPGHPIYYSLGDSGVQL